MCVELERTDTSCRDLRMGVPAALPCACEYQVEIHSAAAVIVTNFSSELLISQRWQLITIHTSGKYLSMPGVHTNTHGNTHTVF